MKTARCQLGLLGFFLTCFWWLWRLLRVKTALTFSAIHLQCSKVINIKKYCSHHNPCSVSQKLPWWTFSSVSTWAGHHYSISQNWMKGCEHIPSYCWEHKSKWCNRNQNMLYHLYLWQKRHSLHIRTMKGSPEGQNRLLTIKCVAL